MTLNSETILRFEEHFDTVKWKRNSILFLQLKHRLMFHTLYSVIHPSVVDKESTYHKFLHLMSFSLNPLEYFFSFSSHSLVC